MKKSASSVDREIGWILQEKHGGKMTAAARKDIERLKAGEPLDHIIGFTEFLGCKILVGPDVLIPRPETELMAEEGIEEVHKVFKVRKVCKVLDMFAGSGAIGIAIMRHVKNAHVVFAESETAAIKQIEKNCKLNNIAKRKYKIIRSDVFADITGTFDYIFANPPYIPNNPETRNKLQKSVINYEPHVALFGGEDGLFFIEKFFVQAKNFLNPDGKIYMEFDSPQKPAIAALLKKLKYQKWDFHRDQYGKWRWVVVEWSN